MTTIEQLRITVDMISEQIDTLQNRTRAVERFMKDTKRMIREENPFASTIDVDAFIAIQTPLFISMLTEVEEAADALNTDVLA